jgi:hypothetical protein
MNSTLALKKSDYEQEVGAFMGWRRGADAGDTPWSASQVIKIQMDVASGLRRYYFCGHPWSFLKPMAEITLASGASTAKLPADFCGIDGGTKCLVLNSSDSRVGVLNFTSAGRVQAAFTDSSATGPPQAIAMRPVKNQGPNLQREELAVFPTADQAYTLKFPYFFTPDYLLDVKQPYAYGGVEHHETILECCLAIAEMRRDNAMGLHSAEAQRLLALSIKFDARKQPKNLGYNRDLSDCVSDEHWNNRGMTISSGVVINGITYS